MYPNMTSFALRLFRLINFCMACWLTAPTWSVNDSRFLASKAFWVGVGPPRFLWMAVELWIREFYLKACFHILHNVLYLCTTIKCYNTTKQITCLVDWLNLFYLGPVGGLRRDLLFGIACCLIAISLFCSIMAAVTGRSEEPPYS